jgi:hypothetical protein
MKIQNNDIIPAASQSYIRHHISNKLYTFNYRQIILSLIQDYHSYFRIIIIIIIIMALQPFVGPWSLYQFLDRIHSRYDSLDGRSARRKASTYIQNNTNTEETHTIQISMPWVGFEPTIPTFELAKTVHALDRAATVIGIFPYKNCMLVQCHACPIRPHILPLSIRTVYLLEMQLSFRFSLFLSLSLSRLFLSLSLSRERRKLSCISRR